jgi:ketosteroid isomerase-like protein
LLLCGITFAQKDRDRAKDRETITRLENEWLHARDATTLDRILAPDFVHVIPVDHFMTKEQHIDWHMKHPEPEEHHTKFDKFNVRFYGDTAIVNGSVIATNPLGKVLERTMLTDVFVLRDRRWQAVNAQENGVRP